MRTYVPRGRDTETIEQGGGWFVVDAAGQVLGRVATRIARILIGKDKANYTPYLDCGDHVVVINADKIRLTGNKLEQKVYRHHSGYPGGLKEVPAKRLRPTRADWMLREAVLGMLPKNKLRALRAKKLRIYLDDKGLQRHAGKNRKLLHSTFNGLPLRSVQLGSRELLSSGQRRIEIIRILDLRRKVEFQRTAC
jgi:large subunit ribosomal protein L13